MSKMTWSAGSTTGRGPRARARSSSSGPRSPAYESTKFCYRWPAPSPGSLGRVGEEAMQRFEDTRAAIRAPVQARRLEGLWDVLGARVSRTWSGFALGPVTATGNSIMSSCIRYNPL